MSLGLIARADNTGLGNQSWELHRHLRPDKTLIVDLAGRSASGKDLTTYPGRFSHGQVSSVAGVPSDKALEDWLEGLTTVLTLETPYNYRLYTIARQRGIRTVLQGNWELLDYLQPGEHQDHLPDVLALPSTWHLTEARHLFGDRMEVIHLPVPIPADRFTTLTPPEFPTRFLHPAGYPAVGDRNGTADVLSCLRYVKSRITVTVSCQRPGYLGGLIRPGISPPNVTLEISSAPAQDYWSLYQGQHAVILPRRYGGLCLPLNESIAAGLPVIMPDISPNSDWLPPEWLVPARQDDVVMTKTPIDVYRTEPKELAARIDLLAGDEEMYGLTCFQARRLSSEMSWDSDLFEKYRTVLRI